MQLIYYPDNQLNPYQSLFAHALAAHGIGCAPGETYSDDYLRNRAGDVQGVHLHWLENLVRGHSSFKRLRNIMALRGFMRAARECGMRLIWTVHNHERHAHGQWIDGVADRQVAAQADLLITHSEWSAGHVRDAFKPNCDVVVMPHGNYDGCFHPARPPEQTRRDVGLRSDTPVVGIIGSLRPNRGHGLALDAMPYLDDDVQLFLAGDGSSDDAAALRTRAEQTPNVVTRWERPNDDTFAEYVQACDVVLLPYDNITGSGALLAAWTLARPVVMTPLPFFEEFAPSDPAAGVVMEERTGEALAASVTRLLAIGAAERSAAARAVAEQYAWERVVEPVARAITAWDNAAVPGAAGGQAR